MKTIKDYVDNIQLFEKKEYEFKLRLNRQDPENWVKTVVAFANEESGYLYIGVADNGYAKGFNSNEVDDEQKYFVDFVRNKVSPAINFDITHIETEENKIIICVHIPVHEGDCVVYKDNSSGGVRERVYRRYPGSTYELTNIREIANFAIKKEEISYDLIPTDFKVEDFTFNSLNEKYKDELNIDTSISIKQLKSIGLVTEDGYLTIAGTYFVDESPKTFPSIHMRKWPGFDKGSDDVIDAKEFKVNLIEQLNEAQKFIRNNTKTGIRKTPDGAKNVWSYPSIAITEAICNAIGHRDYMISGTQIDIDIYADRIEFVSPGSFLPEGRAQDYADISSIPSKRRNTAITDTLAMCNLMQRYGSGFEKIQKEYNKYDEKFQPKVSSEKSWFTITLMDLTYKKEEIKNTVADIVLPNKQKLVYEAILNNPGLKIPELSQICNLKETSVDNAIRALKHKNLITFKGVPKKGGYYTLTETTE